MEKYVYQKDIDLWYVLQGDFYIPCLALNEPRTTPIGMWGRKHLQYIKEYRPAFYNSLLMTGKLNRYLSEIDDQATEMLEQLVKRLAEKGCVTEQLKTQNQMAWVQRMNNIRNTAEEIVSAEVIFV